MYEITITDTVNQEKKTRSFKKLNEVKLFILDETGYECSTVLMGKHLTRDNNNHNWHIGEVQFQLIKK